MRKLAGLNIQSGCTWLKEPSRAAKVHRVTPVVATPALIVVAHRLGSEHILPVAICVVSCFAESTGKALAYTDLDDGEAPWLPLWTDDSRIAADLLIKPLVTCSLDTVADYTHFVRYRNR